MFCALNARLLTFQFLVTPLEGRFPSLQTFRTWRTEGVVQTTNNSSKSEGKCEYYGQERSGYGRIKWKPKIFPPCKQALPLAK